MIALRIRLIADITAAFVCAVSVVLIEAKLASPVRPAFVLIGLVIGSGWSLAGWINLPRDFAYLASVTLAIGCAVPISLGVIMVSAGWWHPVTDAAVLLAVAGVLNIAQCRRDVKKVLGS